VGTLCADGAGSGKVWVLTPSTTLAHAAVADAVASEAERALRRRADAQIREARAAADSALQSASSDLRAVSDEAQRVVLEAKVWGGAAVCFAWGDFGWELPVWRLFLSSSESKEATVGFRLTSTTIS
jgi:hypothetical protein